MFTIYALTDPRNNQVRYVGVTEDVYTRLTQHVRGENNTPAKNSWIQELRSLNLMLTMTNLEQVEDFEYARERETYWIFHYMTLKANLLNQHLPLLDRHKQIVSRVVASSVRKPKQTASQRSHAHLGDAAKRVERLWRRDTNARVTDIARRARVSKGYASRIIKQLAEVAV